MGEMDQGDYGAAVGYLDRGLAQERQRGNRAGSAVFMMNLGFINLRQGDRKAASINFEEALKTAQGMETPNLTISIHVGLAAGHKAQAEYEMAIQSFDKALEIGYCIGDKARQAEILWWKGDVFYAQGLYEKALDLFRASTPTFESTGGSKHRSPGAHFKG